ncbi:non-ribosomal peptide synthetase [Granulosicoccus antarcticus]|uniref:Polyketide synthase PksJ n=1 Tax=Granulosicoccus antarcticus IMCC3135 TaxID=1192854 RepID=A0A2Z2NW86_9GAMM|nr:non-ribosomal peptide synthetase [Granulosicoccus antarcticus]ASJ71957.1 Polyketide synthase PksJ [Granulosicoccus antarcticus IMCC3135]
MESSSALSFWATATSQQIDPLEIPCDRPRLKISDNLTTANVEVPFTRSIKLIDQIATQCNVSPEVVCQAVYSILLYRYTGKSLLRIGYLHSAPASNINTETTPRVCFPLITRISAEDSAREHIEQLSQAFSKGEILSLENFETVAQKLAPQGAATSTSPCEIALSYGNTPAYNHSDDTLELLLSVIRQDDEAILNIRYLTALFNKETITRLTSHYEHLLEAVASAPDTLVSQLKMLGTAERDYLLHELNDTTRPYPSNSTIVDLFATQARLCPDSIAVRGPNEHSLTYQQLDEASNQLAHYLNEKNVQKADRIGLYLERDTTLMIALFGVMKSGASYVPLDPMFPKDRLNFMVQDSSAKYVLTQPSLVDGAPCSQAQTLVLDDSLEVLQDQSNEPIQLSSAQSEAYAIYTSGSTGVPKGVMIAHQGLTNFLVSILDAPGVTKNDRMLAVTTLSFDISIIELFAPLLVGAQVILASREQAMSPELLSARIKSVDANYISATPATWKMLLDNEWSGSSTMKALCGGEALTRDLADRLTASCKELWNMYGPTETTVYSTTEKIEPGNGSITVGRPIANTTLYVLDESMNVVPVSVPGELYIGGDGVAEGYLNRDELTAERFVADPFQATGTRMYRTGDAARWLANGYLEVQGRLDEQVKLRGFRIELGEIRARLVESLEIRDATVIVREDTPGEAKLVAYLVPELQTNSFSTGELRATLKRTLPEYMVPEAWVILDNLPQTPNGKVDRKQLPVPDQSILLTSENLVAPGNDSEEQIALIWKEALRLEQVGVHNSFFELGGQSIQAANLVAKLQDRLNLSIPLLDIFQGTTIASLARRLDGEEVDQAVQQYCRLITSPVDKQPVFMVGSNPLFSLACARLEGQHPVYQVDSYALQIERRLAGKRLLKSIEELSTELLLEIKKVQPQGPYLIGGGCEGALIAFEIALQLQRQGQEVEKLMNWHTAAPGPDLTTDFGEPPLRALRWCKWRFKTVLQDGSIKNLGLKGFKELLRHEFVEYSLFTAMYSYKINGKFNGSMDMVVLTQMEEENDFSERTMGWKNHLTGRVSFYELGGTHDTWLEDNAEGFSEFLYKTLVPA